MESTAVNEGPKERWSEEGFVEGRNGSGAQLDGRIRSERDVKGGVTRARKPSEGPKGDC